MTLTQGNDPGPHDYGDPKSPTHTAAAEQRATQAQQLREEHDTRRDQWPSPRLTLSRMASPPRCS